MGRVRAQVVGAAGLGVLALGSVLGGCASQVVRRDAGVEVGNQAAAWEVVLPSESVALAEGPESARRDGMLLTHADEGSYPPDMWPEGARDDLDNLRRFYMGRNSREVLYFSSQWGWRAPAYRGW